MYVDDIQTEFLFGIWGLKYPSKFDDSFSTGV